MPYAPPRHGADKVEKRRLERQKDYNQFKREGQSFYNSGAWRRLRNWYIKTNPLCVECKRAGVIVAADIVDHITPVKKGGDKLSRGNLQGLCTYHHGVKTESDKQ